MGECKHGWKKHPDADSRFYCRYCGEISYPFDRIAQLEAENAALRKKHGDLLSAAIKEAAFILRERFNDLPEDSEERFRLCAIRLKTAIDLAALQESK